MLKNLVSPKKSSTFAADFATNENETKSIVIFERLIDQDVVQESRKLLDWETEKRVIRNLYYTVPVNKYTID